MRRAYLDACIAIYLVEKTAGFHDPVRRYLAEHPDTGLCVSPLVRMETLVKPIRNNSDAYRIAYEKFLGAQEWLPINDPIFNHALQLRAREGLRTPDALHLATALHYGCDEFWTNDDRLNKAAGGMAVNLLVL